jgi:hypothetical protein
MTATFECFKCSGSGKIAAFSGIANGVCFQCSGSGKLTSKAAGVRFEPVAPVIPEAMQATIKQWEFLVRLCGDDDRKFRAALKAVGHTAPAAQVYVTRQIMSKAIDYARGMGA